MKKKWYIVIIFSIILLSYIGYNYLYLSKNDVDLNLNNDSYGELVKKLSVNKEIKYLSHNSIYFHDGSECLRFVTISGSICEGSYIKMMDLLNNNVSVYNIKGEEFKFDNGYFWIQIVSNSLYASYKGITLVFTNEKIQDNLRRKCLMRKNFLNGYRCLLQEY